LIEDKETSDPSAKKGTPTTKSHNTAHVGIYTYDQEDIIGLYLGLVLII